MRTVEPLDVRETVMRLNDEAAALRERLTDVEQALKHQRAIAAFERSRADGLAAQVAVAWKVAFGRAVPARRP